MGGTKAGVEVEVDVEVGMDMDITGVHCFNVSSIIAVFSFFSSVIITLNSDFISTFFFHYVHCYVELEYFRIYSRL